MYHIKKNKKKKDYSRLFITLLLSSFPFDCYAMIKKYILPMISYATSVLFLSIRLLTTKRNCSKNINVTLKKKSNLKLYITKEKIKTFYSVK